MAFQSGCSVQAGSAFPGVFRGALDAQAREIPEAMKVAAARGTWWRMMVGAAASVGQASEAAADSDPPAR